MTVHPELSQILDKYHSILADYDSGNLDLASTQELLSRLQVIDGAGMVWGINPETGFFTKASPGQAPMQADASEFAPNQINTSPSPLPSSPMSRPPVVSPSTTPSTPWDQGHTAPDAYDNYTAPKPPPSRRPGGKKSSRSPRLSSPGLFGANRRVIIIGAIVVVVIIIAFVAKKPSATAPTSTLPPIQSTSSTAPTTTTTIATTTTTVPGGTLGRVPTTTQMNDVFSALSQGSSSLATIRQNIVAPGTGVSIIEHVAFFSGLASVQATISDSRPRIVAGGASSSFSLRAPGSHTLLYTGTAHWVVRAGTWKLATWPTLS
jgi:hypothetical protein